MYLQCVFDCLKGVQIEYAEIRFFKGEFVAVYDVSLRLFQPQKQQPTSIARPQRQL